MARARSSRFYGGSFSVDVDLDDVFQEVDDDTLRALCVERGILPKSAESNGHRSSVSLSGDDIEEIRDRMVYRDFEGAALHLDRCLPRDLRVFGDAFSASQGARS